MTATVSWGCDGQWRDKEDLIVAFHESSPTPTGVLCDKRDVCMRYSVGLALLASDEVTSLDADVRMLMKRRHIGEMDTCFVSIDANVQYTPVAYRRVGT